MELVRDLVLTGTRVGMLRNTILFEGFLVKVMDQKE